MPKLLNSNEQYPVPFVKLQNTEFNPKKSEKKKEKKKDSPQITVPRACDPTFDHVHKVSLFTNPPPSAPASGGCITTGIGQLGFLACPPPTLAGNNGGNPSACPLTKTGGVFGSYGCLTIAGFAKISTGGGGARCGLTGGRVGVFSSEHGKGGEPNGMGFEMDETLVCCRRRSRRGRRSSCPPSPWEDAKGDVCSHEKEPNPAGIAVRRTAASRTRVSSKVRMTVWVFVGEGWKPLQKAAARMTARTRRRLVIACIAGRELGGLCGGREEEEGRTEEHHVEAGGEVDCRVARVKDVAAAGEADAEGPVDEEEGGGAYGLHGEAGDEDGCCLGFLGGVLGSVVRSGQEGMYLVGGAIARGKSNAGGLEGEGEDVDDGKGDAEAYGSRDEAKALAVQDHDPW